jgi:hypothetical protein
MMKTQAGNSLSQWLIVQGQVMTPGTIDNRHPVPELLKRLHGRVFGDRGYISSKLGRHLRAHLGIALITKLRRKMKNRLMVLSDKLWLRKRGLLEAVNDQLKNIAQIEHTRHIAAQRPLW